jgi:hypothetical protein
LPVDLLAPLTSAADLPNHPSYSVAYTSKHLTNMTKEAASVSRKEQISLWHAKSLFNKLQGDSSFAPQALAPIAHNPLKEFGSNGTDEREANGSSEPVTQAQDQGPNQEQGVVHTTDDVDMEGAGQMNGSLLEVRNGDISTAAMNGKVPVINGTLHEANAENPPTNGETPQSPTGDDVSETASQQTAHRMTTRARAQAASTPSPPSSPSSIVHGIHPIFTFATDSLPDRDFGLPPGEAEETRMLLMAYVQKQEEISRVATDLYHGMLQGERMRQDVFKWSKAEAHIGEMSDGEDWYDREEWSLEQDLMKGRDEEEDDTQVAGKKSTRQRRKPDKEDR